VSFVQPFDPQNNMCGDKDPNNRKRATARNGKQPTTMLSKNEAINSSRILHTVQRKLQEAVIINDSEIREDIPLFLLYRSKANYRPSANFDND
jgi:hypothetical protein